MLDLEKECPCGSGRPYRLCHWNVIKDGLLNSVVSKAANVGLRTIVVPGTRPHYGKGDLIALSKEALDHKYCSCPPSEKGNCSGGIIRAHTIAKSDCLKRIASDGHVYSIIPDLTTLMKYNGKLTPRLVGINKASTMTGFCAIHDRDLFLQSKIIH